MNEEQWKIDALTVATIGSAAVVLLLYWFIICVKLYRRGAGFPTGLIFWRFFDDLRAYKEIILSEGGTPTIYYTIIFFSWATVLLAGALGVIYWRHASDLQNARRRIW